MTLVFVTLIIVFAAIWIGFHIAKSITVPIEKLAQATKEVSRGQPVRQGRGPRLGRDSALLIDSFNQMTADLRTGQETGRQKTAEVAARQAVHRNRPQHDHDRSHRPRRGQGIVTTINPSARDMLALPDEASAGRPFRDVLAPERYSRAGRGHRDRA